MIVLDLSILNQKGTPMFNSDTFANRPSFGIVGRIFISTDTAAIYRDTGTAWDLIADGGSSSTNIYNSNGTLSANRTVASGGFNLTFNPSTVFDTTLTAANNASSLALFGVNRLSYAAAFSANNIGALYGGGSAFALQTFAGSATFANSNVASGGSSVNSIDFSSGGSTITMTQSSGIRAMSGQQNLFQYQGTNSGTITHAAISQNTGFYRPSAATGILTITNAYSHLINALDDYGAGFTFTNRWGIYQAGASDLNYFAANMLLGSTTNNGNRLQVNGTGYINNTLILDGTNTGQYLNFYNSGVDRAHIYWQESLNNLAIGTYVAGGSIQFEVGNNVDAMFLNSSGNLGLGVTPSAWSSPFKVIQGGGSGFNQFVAFQNNDNSLKLGTNHYYNGSNYIYENNGFASRLDINSVQFIFNIAASGIAGNPITFIPAMTLANSGNLLLGTTTDAGNKLYLNGSLRIDGQLSASAGGNSGQHLTIVCDGTIYKIQLLNN
jgi:hypothetical protein